MDIKKHEELFADELFTRVIPFWMKNGQDCEFGGLLHCLDKHGDVFSYDKGVWMQGRAGWTFSYLYNNFDKNPQYLKIAKNCIDFARDKCFLDDGRMAITVGRDGEIVAEQGDGWFSEAFYISACAEYYAATKDLEYLAEARMCYDRVLGWYRAATTAPCQENGRKYRKTKAFAQPMILVNVNSIMRSADPEREELYNRIADGLVADVKKFHIDEHSITVENISMENKLIADSGNCRICNPGHVIECSWFLLDEAITRGDGELAEFAEQMFNEAYERGLDKKHGGILYNIDIFGAPVEAYEQDMKIWWAHNETVIASLMLYLHTGKEKYARIFEETVEYSFSHFVDKESGEWYANLNRAGTPIEPNLLAFLYKGPFHVPRMLAKCLIEIEKRRKCK